MSKRTPRVLRMLQVALKRDGQTTMKTDTQVQQDVIAELKWEPSINAAQIGVEVKDGIVTLHGHVRVTQKSGGPSALPNAYRASRRWR